MYRDRDRSEKDRGGQGRCSYKGKGPGGPLYSYKIARQPVKTRLKYRKITLRIDYHKTKTRPWPPQRFSRVGQGDSRKFSRASRQTPFLRARQILHPLPGKIPYLPLETETRADRSLLCVENMEYLRILKLRTLLVGLTYPFVNTLFNHLKLY